MLSRDVSTYCTLIKFKIMALHGSEVVHLESAVAALLLRAHLQHGAETADTWRAGDRGKALLSPGLPPGVCGASAAAGRKDREQ